MFLYHYARAEVTITKCCSNVNATSKFGKGLVLEAKAPSSSLLLDWPRISGMRLQPHDHLAKDAPKRLKPYRRSQL
jgi:hypothetical protein